MLRNKPCCGTQGIVRQSIQQSLRAAPRFRHTYAADPRPVAFAHRRCTALVNSASAVETLASVSETQVQESLQVLRKTRLITAIKTPYREDGKFDLRAYDAHIQRQIEHGVEGVIVGGTTGEGQLMSWDEHVMLIAHTVNSFGSHLQVIGNTGSNSTREALHATEQGFAVGMDAALQINPYYGKTSLDGLIAHFSAVLDEGPTIVYNVPSRTGQDVPDHVVQRLSYHSNWLGVKECTGNQRIQSYSDQGIMCWSGNDDEAHDSRHNHGGQVGLFTPHIERLLAKIKRVMVMGNLTQYLCNRALLSTPERLGRWLVMRAYCNEAGVMLQGVISVTSNMIPGAFSAMMQHPDPELNQSLQQLMTWLFCEPNPVAVNTAMAMCGLIKPVFRLPYVPLSRDKREEGAKLLRQVIHLIPGCKEVRILKDEDFVIVSKY